MTPKEFEKEMKKIIENKSKDTEYVHLKMDELMCKVLEGLGYQKGVSLFKNTERWYA